MPERKCCDGSLALWLLLARETWKLGPGAHYSCWAQADPEAVIEHYGDRVFGEERVERTVVIPGGDQADVSKPGGGQQPCAKRGQHHRLGVAQAPNLSGARWAAQDRDRVVQVHPRQVKRSYHSVAPSRSWPRAARLAPRYGALPLARARELPSGRRFERCFSQPDCVRCDLDAFVAA